MPKTLQTSKGGGALIIVCFFLAVLLPNAAFFGLGILGPSPWQVNRGALGEFADKAQSRFGGLVETRQFSSQTEARKAARRYVDRVASAGRAKLGDEYTFNREDGSYEIVVSIDGVLVRVQGRDEPHARSLFAGLPFVHENPEPNLIAVLFRDHLVSFLAGGGLYVTFLLVVFSRWSSASMTLRPETAGPPAREHELKSLLLKLNELDAPVSVTEGADNRQLIEWRVVDAQWRSVLQQNGLRLRHSMLLDFDNRSHTVRAIHTTRRMRWSRGLFTSFGWVWARSVVGYEMGAETAYGVLLTDEGWAIGEAYRYRYIRSELVQPAIAAIVHSGWTYRPVYTFFRPLGG